jgi:murein DD-endopeptidase MepM/ murein hydrolase activator NlpD
MSEDLRHRNTSFSYKTIHPSVRRVLDARSNINNTIQVASPFVKATSTLDLGMTLGPKYDGCVGFTLGPHMLTDGNWFDLYSSTTSGESSPFIGYTYLDNVNKFVYAERDQETTNAIQLLEADTFLYNDVNSSFIPPPGITATTIGRNKNGLIISAQINFSVPHLLQLEALHRTFLVPGAGMILEWGQKFAPETSPSYGEVGPIEEYLFPWYDRQRLLALLERLGQRKVSLQEILQCYTYPTHGQYSWMFGRVANFGVKSNGASFDCTVKIVGPSEDAWAYTTTTTVIPARINKNNSTKFCPNLVDSVETYFTNTSVGLNLKTLLMRMADSNGGAVPAGLNDWIGHVKFFGQGNQAEGDPEKTPSNDTGAGGSFIPAAGAAASRALARARGFLGGVVGSFKNDTGAENQVLEQIRFGDSEDAYFMSWRFFVNVVLNDDTYGIKAIFRNAGLSQTELDKVGVLRPYVNSLGGNTNNFVDPLETYVGNSEFLRSKDPATLIIVNELAVDNATKDLAQYVDTNEMFPVDVLNLKEINGDFSQIQTQTNNQIISERGFLSTGVWLNHKAVCHAMLSAQTVIGGIVNLLSRMNSATTNYWRLTLDPAEPIPPEVCGEAVDELPAINYQVIDANYKDNAEYAVSNFIENVHIFNKNIRQSGNNIVGSELLTASVSLDLPKRLFTQIATMGLVQQSDIDNVFGSDSGEQPDDPVVSDPNETLRKMFAITTLAANAPNQRGPDLTIPSELGRKSLLASNSCGGTIDLSLARTQGTGVSVGDPAIADLANATVDDLVGRITDLDETIRRSCQGCESPSATTEASLAQTRTVDYTKPLRGAVNSDFRISSPVALSRTINGVTRPHKGIDIARPLSKTAEQFRGTPVYAAADGIVSRAERGRSGAVGFGNVVEIRHPALGTITRYAHLDALNTSVDTIVQKGVTQIGRVGDSGAPGNVHLHFEIRESSDRDAAVIDPGPIFVTEAPAPTTPPPISVGPLTPECIECNTAKEQKRQITVLLQEKQQAASINKTFEDLKRQFPNLGTLYRYIETMPALMVSNISRRGSDGNRSNAFGAAPGTLSIAADFEMPGISGLRIGELFWMDRMPTFYRAFGAFQIISIEDTIGLDGWKTKIHSRFNFLGNLWKEQMYERLRRGIDVSTRTPSTEVSSEPTLPPALIL